MTPEQIVIAEGKFFGEFLAYCTTVILLATVASVLWKAAKSNPVEALKYE